MAVTAFGDLPLADRERSWDGAAAEKRVRAWAKAEDTAEQSARAKNTARTNRTQGVKNISTYARMFTSLKNPE